MRELKFRAWDNENKCFFESTYEGYNNKIEELNIGMSGQLAMRTIDKFIHLDSMEPGRFILEQSTGKKDVNNVDIYEGDIVYRCPKPKNVKDTKMYKTSAVVWSNTDAQFYYDSYVPLGWTGFEFVEIIGNIHENPELL